MKNYCYKVTATTGANVGIIKEKSEASAIAALDELYGVVRKAGDPRGFKVNTDVINVELIDDATFAKLEKKNGPERTTKL